MDYTINVDNIINNEYNRIRKKKPITAVYLSKTQTLDTKVRLDEILNCTPQDYNNNTYLANCIEFCNETKSALVIGDSVGFDRKNPKGSFYLIKTLNKLIEPVELNTTGLMSMCYLFDKIKNERSKRTLETGLIRLLREYKVI